MELCYLHFLVIVILPEVSLQMPLSKLKRISSPVKVLIVTEMRSGSSVIGELFNVNPDVFYMYEPLRAIENLVENNAHLCHLNRTCLPEKLQKYYEEEIKTIFLCNFDRVKTAILADDFLRKSKSTERFSQCIHNKAFKDSNIKNCLPQLINSCFESSFRVVKTIRFKMNQVHKLLIEYPELKIIYLVRDPRATLHSREKLAATKSKNLEVKARKLCSQISEDVMGIEHLKNIFKGRILTIYYEKFAYNPLQITSTVYDFLNRKTPETVEKWVKENTLNNIDVFSGDYSTTRRNAIVTANRWRQEMDINSVAMTDVHCKGLLQTLGYSLLTNEKQLRNISHSFLD